MRIETRAAPFAKHEVDAFGHFGCTEKFVAIRTERGPVFDSFQAMRAKHESLILRFALNNISNEQILPDK